MKARILIVEDNPLIVKFYRLALERKAGYAVQATEDVDQILALAASGAVDLVILDISLSGAVYAGKRVDGIGIAGLLRQDPKTASIPILIATAHAMEGDKEKITEATGADGYLQKPIYDASVLISKVEELLPKRS